MAPRKSLHDSYTDAGIPQSDKSLNKVIVSNNVWKSYLVCGDFPFCGDLGVGRETVERFVGKITTDGPLPADVSLGPCWLWTGSTARGYGQFVLPRDLYGKQPHVYAHRFIYELTFGRIGDIKIKCCHRCDNPLCANPAHLFLGTQGDNLADARAKGRLIDGLHNRKLSDAAYAEILSSPRTRGVGIALARKFGVSETTICRIRTGRQGSTYQPLQPTPAPTHEPHGDNEIMLGLFERVRTVEIELRGEVR